LTRKGTDIIFVISDRLKLLTAPRGGKILNIMNRIIEQLTPEDFGKPLDPALFAEWKQAMNDQAKTGVLVIVIWLVGLALLLILGGLVGLALFFAAMFTAMGMSLSKQKKTKESQTRLGVDKSEVQQAMAHCRNRIKQTGQ
jgi:hypothetical protein